MLKDRNSSAIIAVSDIARARAFYQDVLGLVLVAGGEDEDMLGFQTGDTWLTVYRSDFAGTNRANAVTWDMKGDIVETVDDLRSRGVVFERYPDMGLTLNGDIHEAGEMKMVWFKDPDGNILHLVQGM
jgi:catechol 2,3-dioxygenase-like lactoylglutathione lyase family enzyme